MAPLGIDKIHELATHIQQTLSQTAYACSSLTRITGGSASFTFRGVLSCPLVLANKDTITTVIVKKATDFAAINSNFPLDSDRSTYEDAMLKTMSHVTINHGAAEIPIRTPMTLYYNDESKVQVVEDLKPAMDLANVLTLGAYVGLKFDFDMIGYALGSWLRAFHNWAKEPDQLELKRFMEGNESSRELKWRTTYDTIVQIAETFSAISKADIDVLRAVKARAYQEYQGYIDGSLDKESQQLLHGDFWTGNILLTPNPDFQLYIIDFEFAHHGPHPTDLGQMIGDLLEKCYMADTSSYVQSNCKTIIGALVRGYGSVSNDTAHRIVIHAGVHIINWCARHPGQEVVEKVERLMLMAVEMIVGAWRDNVYRSRQDVLQCLFVKTG